MPGRGASRWTGVARRGKSRARLGKRRFWTALQKGRVEASRHGAATVCTHTGVAGAGSPSRLVILWPPSSHGRSVLLVLGQRATSEPCAVCSAYCVDLPPTISPVRNLRLSQDCGLVWRGAASTNHEPHRPRSIKLLGCGTRHFFWPCEPGPGPLWLSPWIHLPAPVTFHLPRTGPFFLAVTLPHAYGYSGPISTPGGTCLPGVAASRYLTICIHLPWIHVPNTPPAGGRG